MLIGKMDEAAIRRAMQMETHLTHREAMILVAITLGTYNDLELGSGPFEERWEERLIGEGLLELNNGELAPTALGTATAQWMVATMIDVISPILGVLLSAER